MLSLHFSNHTRCSLQLFCSRGGGRAFKSLK